MHTPRNALSVSLASSLDSSPGGGAKLNWSRFYKLLTHAFVVEISLPASWQEIGSAV